ncbi:MAG: PAS domain S-box protein [Deltaproteobacteria bacterium]|nr:PAS domain S-box protein [Deltaproteobacteria bacterium]
MEEKILIVDDRDEARYLLETILKSQGYVVIPARNGIEALSRMNSESIDLVITDILMPDMDGFELIRRMRGNENLKGIPVIVYTATYTGPEDENFALKIGANRFLQKPTEPDELIKVVKDILEKKETSIPAEIGEAEALKAFSERLIRKLEIQTERWKNTFESILDGIAIVSPDGTILECNKAMNEILGKKAQEIIGNKCYKVIHGTDEHIEGCPLVKSLTTRKRETMELPDQDRFYMVMVDPIFGLGGNIESFVHILRDVTEEKKREKALRESEERYHFISDLISDYAYAFEVKEDGTLKGLWVTDSFVKVFGLTISEIDERGGWQTMVYKEDLSIAIEHANRVISGQPDICEMRWVTKDGQIRWLRDYAVPVVDNVLKRVTRIYGASQDITERKQMEEALRQSEEFYKAIFENTGTATLIVEEDTTISRANQMALNYIGLKREEFEGKRSWTEFVAEKEDLEKMLEYHRLRRVHPDLAPRSYEFKIKSPSGKIYHALLSAAMIPGTKKSVVSMQDITELKEMEERLLEAEKKYQTIVDNAPEPIVVLQDKLIKFVNRKTEDVYGYSLDELYMRPFIDFVHPEDRERAMDLYTSELPDVESGFTYEIRLIDKNGNTRWTHGTAVNIEWEGRPARLNFIRDVTEIVKAEEEKKRLQEQLLQSQKMEALGRLAGGIAHDFNNILTVIKGSCQLAFSEAKVGEPLLERISEIERAVDKASDLVRHLLAFSRRQIMKMRIVDLNQIVTSIEKMLKRIIGENIEFVTKISKDPCLIMADPSQIEQVIINLAVNAKDAMPKGGKLTISTEKTHIPEEKREYHFPFSGSYVILTVSDTGLGIPKEIQEKIFDPFFTTKEVGKGTGLGLSTVYGIVRQLGGYILLKSEEGKGTVFRIYIPEADESPKEDVEKMRVETHLIPGKGRVLVVEDNDDLKDLITEFLTKKGYEALSAKNAQEALEIISRQTKPIDVLLTDIVMPGISGRELAQTVKRSYPETKILFMSGYMDESQLDFGIFEEGFSFIQKPFDFDTLAKKVMDLLES